MINSYQWNYAPGPCNWLRKIRSCCR
jgi:hypothetical protein